VVLARRARVLGSRGGLAIEARADVARTLGDLGQDAQAITELEAVIAGFLASVGDRSLNSPRPPSCSTG